MTKINILFLLYFFKFIKNFSCILNKNIYFQKKVCKKNFFFKNRLTKKMFFYTIYVIKIYKQKKIVTLI